MFTAAVVWHFSLAHVWKKSAFSSKGPFKYSKEWKHAGLPLGSRTMGILAWLQEKGKSPNPLERNTDYLLK